MNSEHLSLRIYPADVPDIWDFEHLIQGMTLDDQIVIENVDVCGLLYSVDDAGAESGRRPRPRQHAAHSIHRTYSEGETCNIPMSCLPEMTTEPRTRALIGHGSVLALTDRKYWNVWRQATP